MSDEAEVEDKMPSKHRAVAEIKAFARNLKGALAWAEQIDDVDKIERAKVAAEAAFVLATAKLDAARAAQSAIDDDVARRLAAADTEAAARIEAGTAESAKIVDKAQNALENASADRAHAQLDAAAIISDAKTQYETILADAKAKAQAAIDHAGGQVAEIEAKRDSVMANLAERERALTACNNQVAASELRLAEVTNQLNKIEADLDAIHQRLTR